MPKIKKEHLQPEEVEEKVAHKKENNELVVFRLFECVVHLELALAGLKRVGIFPGPPENSQTTKELHAAAMTRVEHLYKHYLTEWGAMSKP